MTQSLKKLGVETESSRVIHYIVSQSVSEETCERSSITSDGDTCCGGCGVLFTYPAAVCWLLTELKS